MFRMMTPWDEWVSLPFEAQRTRDLNGYRCVEGEFLIYDGSN